MKNKKIIILIASISLIVIFGLGLFLFLSNRKKEIVITFDSNGGKVVESVKIKEGEKINLPKTSKDGYIFEGWYLDNTKVSKETIYQKNTTLKAKWLKENAKTYTITFDSDGGTPVEKLTLECDKEITLPANPTKKGYEFVAWIDQHATPILNGALLSCSDISLKADWKKVEEKKTETKKEETKAAETTTTKTVTYTCPTGYILNGTKCNMTKDPTYVCPNGTKVDGSLCIKTSDSNAGTRKCKEQTVSIDGKGHTSTEPTGDFYMVGNSSSSYGKCAYHKWEGLTQSQCDQTYQGTSKKVVWVSELNACYAETKMNNYETVCASDYQYYSSADLSSKFGIHDNGKCLKKMDKEAKCDSEYVLTSGKCVKTIDASAN